MLVLVSAKFIEHFVMIIQKRILGKEIVLNLSRLFWY